MADPVDLFEAFEWEVLSIRRAWQLWRLIMGYQPEDVDGKVLFDAAPTFHFHTSQSLLASVVLALSRLTDPTTDHQGRDNLTMERIYLDTDFKDHSDQFDRACHAMNEALKAIQSDSFKRVRNKALAHNDLISIIAKDASVEIELISKGVEWVARFHTRIKSVREGYRINHATGEGAFPLLDEVQVCVKEIASLIDRLQRSK